MATFTVTASGFLSNLSIYSGSPTAAPVAADVLLLSTFTVTVDYSIALASVVTNGGTLIAANGNITIDITAATLTGHLKIKGGPRQVSGSGATAVSQGVGGVG